MTDAEIAQIDADGFVDVQCTSCGEFARMEPDADGEDCPQEDCDGSLTSPLRAEGLI